MYSAVYQQLRPLGHGASAQVFQVRHLATGAFFAAKKISLAGLPEEQATRAITQLTLNQCLSHKHIVKFYRAFHQPPLLILILEYCEDGSLTDQIKLLRSNGEHFAEEVLMNLFLQVVFGLRYLHRMKVMHRDLKAQNVLLNDHGEAKLADFGVSAILQRTTQFRNTLLGTPSHISPQACSKKKTTLKSDIWALGCLLYEMCALTVPFPADNILILAQKVVLEEPPNIPSFYSKQLSSLVQVLLQKLPDARPSPDQILSMPLCAKYAMQFQDVNSPMKRSRQDSRLSLEDSLSPDILQKLRIMVEAAHESGVSQEQFGKRVNITLDQQIGRHALRMFQTMKGF